MKFIAIVISLLLFGLLERRWPFFHAAAEQWKSWVANVELAMLNLVAVRYSTALLFQQLWPASENLGLFHGEQGLGIFAIAVLTLDCYIYFWHRLMHNTAWGWRLHAVHHSDAQLSVTTAYRFHTLEVLLSQLPKIALICLLGMPPAYLLIYESLYAAELLFHHSNWALPQPWDRWLSQVIVTPHYHRGHHSEQLREQNANYASFLTIWDVLFGSWRYPRQPEQIRLGVMGVGRSLNAWSLLKWPFLPTSSASGPSCSVPVPPRE